MLSPEQQRVWQLARVRLFRPVDGILLAVVVAYLLGFRLPTSFEYIPFAVGLVAFGLPHGALDHLVPSRLAACAPSAGSMLRVGALYLVLGSVVVSLWLIAPLAAFVLFILMTLYHWGQGDVYVSSARSGASVESTASKIVGLIVRGSLPMVVPLVAFPSTYLAVMGETSRVFSGSTAAVSAVALPGPGVRIALAAALCVLCLVHFGMTVRGASRTGAGRAKWVGDLGEVMLLAVFFSTVPPVLAVGLYFCLWHSLRHIVRLALLDPTLAGDARVGRFARVLGAFTVRAAPLTVAALGLLVGMFLVIPRPSGDAASFLGVYLVLISALTLPHVAIVTFMDSRQGVWSQRVPVRPISGAIRSRPGMR